MTERSAETASSFLRMSIFARCALLVALTTAIVAAVISVRTTSTARNVAIDGLRVAALQLTTQTAAQLGGAIRFSKPDDIVAQLRTLIDTEGSAATAGLAVDIEGNIVAVYGGLDDADRTELAELAREAIDQGQRTTSGSEIRTASVIGFGGDNAGVGALAVAWSAADKLSVISAANQRSYAFSAAVFAAMLGISAFMIRRTIASPLRALRKAIGKVSNGDYGLDVPETHRSDEIGEIAKSLQMLVEKLEHVDEINRDAIFKGAGFEGSSAALALLNTEGVIIASNPAFERFGSEVFGKDTTREISPAELHMALAIVMTESQPIDVSVSVDNRKVRAFSNQICDADGKTVGTVLELADVTDEMRNAAILNAIDESQVVAEFTPAGVLVTCNENFAATLDSTAADLKTVAASDLQPTGSSPAIAEACRETVMTSGSFMMARRGQDIAYVDGLVVPILDEAGKVHRYMLIGTDTTEATKAMREADTARQVMVEQQNQVVEALKQGLARLSSGDLTSSIDFSFPADYEALRQDYNKAVDKLDEAMASVVENARSIRSETSEISRAAEDLSKRTEHQAAALEETAAALTQITASVASAADGARQADEVVSNARSNAEDSGIVVRQAVDAMQQIAESSEQISRIIGVIDDIAFQTNLLALNAGVEAARAGDAGRGFAVVASEVRALAQRSSDAASEINDLITKSGQQVSKGVELVGNAGQALTGIVDSVEGISGHVSAIAASAQEQSVGLQEINTAMSQLDQVTQQNAAMFEETTAASHALTQEAIALATTTERFKTTAAPSAKLIPGPTATASVGMADTGGDRQIAATSNYRKKEAGSEIETATFHRGSTSAQPLAVLADEDDWEDF